MYLKMKQKQKRVIDCNSAAGTSTNGKSLPMLSLSTTAASVRSVLCPLCCLVVTGDFKWGK